MYYTCQIDKTFFKQILTAVLVACLVVRNVKNMCYMSKKNK